MAPVYRENVKITPVGTHRRGVRLGRARFNGGRFIEPSLPRFVPGFAVIHLIPNHALNPVPFLPDPSSFSRNVAFRDPFSVTPFPRRVEMPLFTSTFNPVSRPRFRIGLPCLDVGKNKSLRP
jgi:hypothetical protein